MSGRRRVWGARRCPSPGARRPPSRGCPRPRRGRGGARRLRVLDERGGGFAGRARHLTRRRRQLERCGAYGRPYDDEAPQHLAAAMPAR